MNRDFAEMLSVLLAEGVEFLVVGAYGLAAHGWPRATGDLDIWVRPTRDNADRVLRALKAFGAPLLGLGVDDLTAPDTVFQIGVVPGRIDILSGITGVQFEEAWEGRLTARISDLDVPVIGHEALVKNKRACGRPKDLADLAWLERKGR